MRTKFLDSYLSRRHAFRVQPVGNSVQGQPPHPSLWRSTAGFHLEIRPLVGCACSACPCVGRRSCVRAPRSTLVYFRQLTAELGLTDPQFAEVVRRDGPALWPSYQERPVVWGWKLAAAEAREIKLRKRDQSREPPPQPEERPIEDPPVLSRIREAVPGATTSANLFYDRNNLLRSPSEGPTPGNHFAVRRIRKR